MKSRRLVWAALNQRRIIEARVQFQVNDGVVTLFQCQLEDHDGYKNLYLGLMDVNWDSATKQWKTSNPKHEVDLELFLSLAESISKDKDMSGTIVWNVANRNVFLKIRKPPE